MLPRLRSRACAPNSMKKYKTEGWFERDGQFHKEEVIIEGKIISDTDLDIAAQYIAERLNLLLNKRRRRTITAAYKRGYKVGYEEGIKDAAKKLLAR